MRVRSSDPPADPSGRELPAPRIGIALRLLPVLGLAFWFLLGFPFGNHNESYDWVVRLDRMSFVESLGNNFPAIVNWRPIATGLAWITYRAGGHSIVLVQLLNFALALVAWLWVASALAERRLFALGALISGGVFFSGYLYLFHLHGIFYSPVLILAAACVVAWRRGPGALPWLFLLALATMFVHPFPVLFWLPFAAGAVLEWPALRSPRALGLLAAASAALVALAVVMGSGDRFSPEPWRQGLLVSYRMVEVNRVVSLVALALAVFTAALIGSRAVRVLLALVTLLAGAWLMRIGDPVLPLWFAVCLLKALSRRWWALAALLVTGFAMPWFNPTGSPTYAVFGLMLAPVVMAAGEPGIERRLGFVNPRSAGALAAATAALLVTLRAGVTVPVVSRLAQPVLAESERTRQLETLVGVLVRSPWRNQPARLYHEADLPRVAPDALDRRHRAPTQELHFESYLDHRRGHPAGPGDTLIVTFGGEPVPGARPVLAVHGRYAGDAVVFAPDSAGEGVAAAAAARR